MKKSWLCQHSRRNKKKNVETVRNANCEASITILIKKNTQGSRKNDPFLKMSPPLNAQIKFQFAHSHDVGVPDTLRLRRVDKETKEIFFQYFNEGMSCIEAQRFHERKISLQENSEHILADAAKNPTRWQAHHLYKIWTTNMLRRGEPVNEEQSDNQVPNATTMSKRSYSKRDAKTREVDEDASAVSLSGDSNSASSLSIVCIKQESGVDVVASTSQTCQMMPLSQIKEEPMDSDDQTDDGISFPSLKQEAEAVKHEYDAASSDSSDEYDDTVIGPHCPRIKYQYGGMRKKTKMEEATQALQNHFDGGPSGGTSNSPSFGDGSSGESEVTEAVEEEETWVTLHSNYWEALSQKEALPSEEMSDGEPARGTGLSASESDWSLSELESDSEATESIAVEDQSSDRFVDKVQQQKTDKNRKKKEMDVENRDYEKNLQPFFPVRKPGLQVIFSNEELTPLDVFRLFLPYNVVNDICTKVEAKKQQGGGSVHQNSNNKQTASVLDPCMFYQFVGFLLYVGMFRFPQLKDYTCNRRNVENMMPLVQSYAFPPKMFMEIFSNLHFATPDKVQEAEERRSSGQVYDQFVMVRSILDRFRKVCKQFMAPSRKICLDEKVVARQSWFISDKQCCQQIVVKHIKLWLLSCPETGYVYDFDLFLGPDKLTCSLVQNLLDKYLSRGYIVRIQSHHADQKHMNTLIEHEKSCVHVSKTCQANQKRELLKKASWDDLRWCHESKVLYVHAENIEVASSSMSAPSEKHNKNKPPSKPNDDLYKFDIAESLFKNYSVLQPYAQWHTKFFLHCMDIMARNSFIMYNELQKTAGRSTISHRDFRLKLIRELSILLPDMAPIILMWGTPSKFFKAPRCFCEMCLSAGKKKNSSSTEFAGVMGET